MCNYPLLYTICKNKALNSVTGLPGHYSTVLGILYLTNSAMSYTSLYGHLLQYNSSVNSKVFTGVLAKCTESGFIKKVHVKCNRSVYSITTEGRAKINELNRVYEALVKDELLKYGNGLFA